MNSTGAHSGSVSRGEKKAKRREVSHLQSETSKNNNFNPNYAFFSGENVGILEKKLSVCVLQMLEKKKSIDELIKRASAEKDHLASFPPFRHFNRNGLSVYLESGSGDNLSFSVKQYIQNLLKVNMEMPYGPEWPMEEKVKRLEMVAPEARYIFVHEAPNDSAYGITTQMDMGKMVGFVHYRFTLEEEIPVLYLYEIQLEACVQGKGLGKFLMQLIELVARKNHMAAVVLTVQKSNIGAMNFYTSKLRYTISNISPSRVDPLLGTEKSYEILCKTFDHEAKAALEDDR